MRCKKWAGEGEGEGGRRAGGMEAVMTERGTIGDEDGEGVKEGGGGGRMGVDNLMLKVHVQNLLVELLTLLLTL